MLSVQTVVRCALDFIFPTLKCSPAFVALLRCSSSTTHIYRQDIARVHLLNEDFRKLTMMSDNKVNMCFLLHVVGFLQKLGSSSAMRKQLQMLHDSIEQSDTRE